MNALNGINDRFYHIALSELQHARTGFGLERGKSNLCYLKYPAVSTISLVDKIV